MATHIYRERKINKIPRTHLLQMKKESIMIEKRQMIADWYREREVEREKRNDIASERDRESVVGK